MAVDADPDLVHSFEARIFNNFFERLQIFVHPQNFDLQTQLSLAFQEEQYKMANWREVPFSLFAWSPVSLAGPFSRTVSTFRSITFAYQFPSNEGTLN